MNAQLFRSNYKKKYGSTKNATKAYKRYIAAGKRRTTHLLVR